ncbi:hypothetical protein DMR_32070 [Solidesulfovibrio magneticus RS-1]|uniref:Uncharacterized protein n=1 Tax=Solidesulfovibrio magneticus (strain ATCC 700980 / DSM 13731 / RS-1) TaxID=573370 RepID=C4XJE8_SOLM1|nr:hypothetical protein DMR_32070 [Solidesulfovibrio magneticus RS-1]
MKSYYLQTACYFYIFVSKWYPKKTRKKQLNLTSTLTTEYVYHNYSHDQAIFRPSLNSVSTTGTVRK